MKHADRTHLEARMSVVLRRLDRRLRFCGMGLEVTLSVAAWGSR